MFDAGSSISGFAVALFSIGYSDDEATSVWAQQSHAKQGYRMRKATDARLAHSHGHHRPMGGIAQVFFPATAAAHIGWQVSPFEFEVGMADNRAP